MILYFYSIIEGYCRHKFFPAFLSDINDKQLSTVRELSIMTAKCHPAAMRFIPDQLESDCSIKDTSSSPDSSEKEPIRFVPLFQVCK